MAEPVRVALIGQKFMGRAHSNAWGQVNRFFKLKRKAVLHTVAARDKRALAAFAKRWGWQHATSDWRELAQSEEIDLVDVGTPNGCHAEQSIAMLEAGKHVACEKPLAGTLADARAMRDAARKARRSQTFVWFNYRRCPAAALARELILAGRLGRILHVRGSYLQSWGGPRTPHSWRFSRQQAGSGAHGDLNSHLIDLARFITGEEVVEVHGAAARTFVERRERAQGGRRVKVDVDDALAFLAQMSSGALASFEASRLATGHHNAGRLEIDGEQASLRLDFEDLNVLWFHDECLGPRTAGWRRILATSAAGAHPWVAAWWPDGHLLGYEHGFVNMAADILAALGGRPSAVPLPDFADAYETQRVLEAASIAARECTAVKLSQVR